MGSRRDAGPLLRHEEGLVLKPRHRQSGISLIEVMVAVAIVGVLMAFAADTPEDLEKTDNNSPFVMLMEVGDQQAVLTISAKEELFYTRRLEVSEQFLAEAWGQQDDRAATGPGDGFAPVEEYVPDYSVGGVSYGNDYSEPRAARQASQAGLAGDGEGAQRFLVEVQRSLDVWDRTWSSMPLNGVTVYAGHRTQELAQWLGVQLGQTVIPMDLSTLFSGFKMGQVDGHALCLPLLGILMRTEDRKL